MGTSSGLPEKLLFFFQELVGGGTFLIKSICLLSQVVEHAPAVADVESERVDWMLPLELLPLLSLLGT